MQTGCSRCNLRFGARHGPAPGRLGSTDDDVGCRSRFVVGAPGCVVGKPVQYETPLFRCSLGSGYSYLSLFFRTNNVERLQENSLSVVFAGQQSSRCQGPRKPLTTAGRWGRRGPETWGRSPSPSRSPNLGTTAVRGAGYGQTASLAITDEVAPGQLTLCSNPGVITVGSSQFVIFKTCPL
jgi:hypothetical protein